MIIKQPRTIQQTLCAVSVSTREPHNINFPPQNCSAFGVNQNEIPSSVRLLVLANGSRYEVDPELLPQSHRRGRHSQVMAKEITLCGSRAENLSRQAFQHEVYSAISEWSSTTLKGFVGVINQLTWHWANCSDAVKKITRKTEHGTKEQAIGCDRKKVHEALQVSAVLNTSVTSTVNYLKRYWASCGAASSRATVKRYTETLKEWGLLDYHSEFQSTGRARNRFYTYLDIPRLLLVAEVIMERLQHMVDTTDIPMPSHWGQFMGWLYDAVFAGWGWRKKGHADAVEPATHEESVVERAMASHESRVEQVEFEPWKLSFRSALQHLSNLVDVCQIKGITKPWHFKISGRQTEGQSWRKSLRWKLVEARHWALSRAANDIDHAEIAAICPLLMHPAHPK